MSYVKQFLFAVCVFIATGFMSQIAIAQQPAVIELEETIRGNQEQPKVLTIVPWQSPKAKQALPSPIVERINKTFVPLERDELKRQIDLLENIKVYPKPQIDT